MPKGLINEQIPEREDDAPEEAAAAAEMPEREDDEAGEGQEDLTPAMVREKLDLPPDLKEAYERVVLAGMKVMFDESTHEMSLKAMQGDGPIEERLATAIAGLMGALVEQSNKTMPPQIIIPAGIELLVAAGDFIKQSGAEPIENAQIGEAIALFIQLVLEQSGAVDPAKMQEMFQGGLGEAGAEAPPTGGLVNQVAEA